MWKIDPKLQKVVFLCFSERCHGNMCNLNVLVVLELISRDLYLLFVILLSSKFQNSIFYQHMRPKSGLKFPRPLSHACSERTRLLGFRYIRVSRIFIVIRLTYFYDFICREQKSLTT